MAGDTRAEAERALAGGEWGRARELFEAALAERETAVALEGLGWAGWWLAEEELTMRARERAYRLHRTAGDPLGAGRVATWLAADFREFRGEDAVGRGWLERAHRLLDPLPESPDHGWLVLIDADFALNVDRDVGTVVDLARAGMAIGRRLEMPDLEAVGLALEGLALVGGGSVGEGIRRLDEAATLAGAEEMRLPIASGWALCCALSACDGIGDFRRAAQWCEAIRRFTDRWGGRQLLGVCRTSYGRILATGGDWPAAESELEAAVADMEGSRPGMAAGGLVRLGELRARQGRVEEARRLFERAGPAGLVGRGELAMAEGDAAWAADAAERLLRRLPESSLLDRVPALELLSEARLRQGELEAGAEHAAAVEAAARSFATPYALARAALCAARVAAAGGDVEAARRAAEDAVDGFEEAAAPYDAARARLELVAALRALGREEAAREEAGAARDAFAALGASRDREAAEELLRGDRLDPAPPASSVGSDPDLGVLTAREVEVLRLVAHGMGDAEIAADLVLSSHTVHRHVANIRTKLGLGSRSAAVAYAARKGLL